MALRLRKDIKKSSYYVWFLGAKESKGLRGSEYIFPVIQHLVEREKDVEPFKVTLQISHKGLKIIQNIVTHGSKNSKPKNETIKHFIPHNTITCVNQQDDIIACILLLFNPVTKCPLHVHAYRCDSLETATLLKQQLQTLIERPENQKKFAEIENRLKTPKEIKKIDSSPSSDTGTSTRESESSEERFSNDRVATLYDSVAAELRAKLKKSNEPILLPPRDYDTVHRQKGNLTGIELRRCLNASIVGQNAKSGRRIDSSGGSSGIGSDLPPSPESPDAPDTRFNTIDNQSTSDEEWNTETADSTLYLMHGSSDSYSRSEKHQKPENKTQRQKDEKHKFLFNDKPMSLERKKYVDERRFKENYDDWNGQDRRYSREKFIENFTYDDEDYERDYQEPPVPKARQNLKHYDEEKRNDWQKKITRPDSGIERYSDKFSRSTEYLLEERKRPSLRQRSPSPVTNETPRERFKDAKEKFLLLEKERLEEQERLRKEAPISPTRKERHFNNRHGRYDKYFQEDDRPEPAPRTIQENVRYAKEISAERYKYDPNRRSMFCVLEEEHKKNSNEIARELKRRSYMENNNYEDDYYRNKETTDGYHPKTHELDPEELKYVRNQRSRNAAGYRHSYAEPKLKLEKSKKLFPDLLQRTNSTVSNSGRVGLASIHPY
ncbi:hypothetical protein FQA39_LY16234 [Lamprigera yunnana]|nr:hypothetical protein FQA39_LY16234 [Lamprigera yunnana]